MMNLTVTICTHNRRELLARAIESVARAQMPDDVSIELLVIANACSDDTEQWLADYPKDSALSLTWATEPLAGKSHALNRAIDMIETPLVFFIDDDQRVAADFFPAIVATVRDYPDATMFCGCVRPDWDGREPDWIHDQERYPIYPKPVPHFEPWDEARPVTASDPIPGGGNLFMYTEVLYRTGHFSTELGPTGDSLAGSEDTDYVLRALSNGERLMYVPSVLQYHYVELERLRLGYLLRKSYERSRSVTSVRSNARSIPLWQWRKLATYALQALVSVPAARRRFFMMRTAAALGEIHAVRGRYGEQS